MYRLAVHILKPMMGASCLFQVSGVVLLWVDREQLPAAAWTVCVALLVIHTETAQLQPLLPWFCCVDGTLAPCCIYLLPGLRWSAALVSGTCLHAALALEVH